MPGSAEPRRGGNRRPARAPGWRPPGRSGEPYANSVIVVGAGPAGTAAALALASHGVRCVLVDQGNGTARPGSRSCGLDASTLAFVHGLTGDRLDAAAEPWGRLRIVRRGRLLADDDAPGVVRYGLAQHRLERALLDAVQAHPLVATAWRHKVEAVEQGADTVTVTARGPAGPVRWRAAWLVACDGYRSAVRRAVGVRFPGRPRVDRLLCADVKAALARDDGDEACGPWLFADPPFDRGATVLAQPLPDDVWRLTWQLPMAHGVARAGEETRVLPVKGDPGDPRRTANRVRAVLRALSGENEAPPFDLLWSGEYEVHQRLARRLRAGRVLLAGDAAHLVHPSVADGVELALRDVRNLAWKLAFVLRGQAPPRLLETYHGERRAATRRRLAVGEDALHFLAPRGPAQRVGRALTLMGARGRLTTLRRLDPHGPSAVPAVSAEYAGSPLLTPGPGVGRPAEDVPIVRVTDASEGWLSECLDRGLLIVLVAPGIQVWSGAHWREAGVMPTLRARAGQLPVPAEIVVTHEYPGAEAHTMVLVRPDGYVAAWLPPGEGDDLEAAVERVRGAAGPAEDPLDDDRVSAAG